MEDELFAVLYRVVWEEAKRRPRAKGVQYADAVILLVALWAVLHDRRMCWACRRRNWRPDRGWIGERPPSASTLSTRLRTLSVQRLLEQVFYRLLSASAVGGFCLCRRVDSK